MTQPQIASTEQAMATGRSAMEQALSGCRSVRASVESSRGELQRSWSGDASMTYGAALNQWLEDLDAIVQSMDGMVQMLGATAQTYQRMEADHQSKAQSLMQQLHTQR